MWPSSAKNAPEMFKGSKAARGGALGLVPEKIRQQARAFLRHLGEIAPEFGGIGHDVVALRFGLGVCCGGHFPRGQV